MTESGTRSCLGVGIAIGGDAVTVVDSTLPLINVGTISVGVASRTIFIWVRANPNRARIPATS